MSSLTKSIFYDEVLPIDLTFLPFQMLQHGIRFGVWMEQEKFRVRGTSIPAAKALKEVLALI